MIESNYKRTSILIFLFIVSFLVFSGYSVAQKKSIDSFFPPVTIGESNCPGEGYFFISSNDLVSTNDSNYIAIIDNQGTPVFFKIMTDGASNFKLQPNGYLSYFSEEYKKIFILDSSYNYTDTISITNYELSDADFIQTTDNESFILATNERFFDMSTLIQGGNTNAIIKESIVLILDDEKNIVFSWNSADHFNIMDVNQASPFVDLISSVIDYISLSDIDIDSDTSFLIACKYMDEITRIDRRSGDIIWRLGGKNNDFTFVNDDIGFSHPTSVQKLPNGNVLIFDSGILHENAVSSIVEYQIDEIAKTATLIRRDGENKNILVSENAGVQNLTNGNKLIYWGDKKPSLTEINPNGTIALELDYSDHSYGKSISKSKWKTNIFSPVVDSINFGMWDYTVFRYLLILKNHTDQIITITDVINNTDEFYIEQTLPFQIPANGTKNLMICFYPEFLQTSVVTDVLTIISDTENMRIAQQVKLVGYRDDFINPLLTIYPENNSTNIKIDTSFYFVFNEPVRFENNTEISYENVSNLVILKTTDENGTDVEFNAAISSDKNKITIVPKNNLNISQTYYLALNGAVEDYYNNTLSSEKISYFTTVSTNSISPDIEFDIQIMPNPVSDYLLISSPIEPISDYSIFNLTGQLIKSNTELNNSQLTIGLNDFVNGVYIIRVLLSNGYSKSFKFIKR